MTQQEAVREQERLSWTFDLSHWFGTKCEKCCGVFPRLCKRDTNDKYHDTYYKCDVCGKQTELFGMPWQAQEAWNKHEYKGEGVQLSFL